MIIVGEKLNSTLKSIRPAMEARDTKAIQDLAVAQAEAGASYIDVNAGMFLVGEEDILTWLVESVQAVTKTPLAIDSPNHIAMEAGLKAVKNGKPLLNSITDEKDRWNEVLPLILKYNTAIVALTMDDSGMPETVDGRVKIAFNMINKLTKEGVKLDDIHIDPLIRPIGTGDHYGMVALNSIMQIKKEFPEVHITGGLSNISFGIPERKLMNQTFLVAAMAYGMDGAIMDPLDRVIMKYVIAAEALLGRDEFCMEYISAYREGLFD